MGNLRTIRCTHKEDTEGERERCFAYNKGMCDALCEPCMSYNHKCKFYKDKLTYINELKQCAKKLDYDFDAYLKITGLKPVVDKLLK